MWEASGGDLARFGEGGRGLDLFLTPSPPYTLLHPAWDGWGCEMQEGGSVFDQIKYLVISADARGAPCGRESNSLVIDHADVVDNMVVAFLIADTIAVLEVLCLNR